MRFASSNSAVVLTTHERSSFFTPVIGYDADMRFDPCTGDELRDLLHNVTVARASIVIIDEASFVTPDEMAFGLESFINEEGKPENTKIIIVCSDRAPGDILLAHLVAYCGIYNIIYACSGVEVSLELERLLEQENSKDDVWHLAEPGKWEIARRVAGSRQLLDIGHDLILKEDDSPRHQMIQRDFILDVRGMDSVCVEVRIRPI